MTGKRLANLVLAAILVGMILVLFFFLVTMEAPRPIVIPDAQAAPYPPPPVQEDFDIGWTKIQVLEDPKLGDGWYLVDRLNSTCFFVLDNGDYKANAIAYVPCDEISELGRALDRRRN
jgi:hypothetical protein